MLLVDLVADPVTPLEPVRPQLEAGGQLHQEQCRNRGDEREPEDSSAVGLEDSPFLVLAVNRLREDARQIPLRHPQHVNDHQQREPHGEQGCPQDRHGQPAQGREHPAFDIRPDGLKFQDPADEQTARAFGIHLGRDRQICHRGQNRQQGRKHHARPPRRPERCEVGLHLALDGAGQPGEQDQPDRGADREEHERPQRANPKEGEHEIEGKRHSLEQGDEIAQQAAPEPAVEPPALGQSDPVEHLPGMTADRQMDPQGYGHHHDDDVQQQRRTAYQRAGGTEQSKSCCHPEDHCHHATIQHSSTDDCRGPRSTDNARCAIAASADGAVRSMGAGRQIARVPGRIGPGRPHACSNGTGRRMNSVALLETARGSPVVRKRRSRPVPMRPG